MYNIKGMAYYLEDGVEENNLFEYNLGAHIHPIKQPAGGDYGQHGELFSQSADLLIPADTTRVSYLIFGNVKIS